MSKIAYLIAKEDWDKLIELKATEPLMEMLNNLDKEDERWFDDDTYTDVIYALGQIGDVKTVDFLIKLHELSKCAESVNLPIAAEACFSLLDLIKNVEERIGNLIQAQVQSESGRRFRKFLYDLISFFLIVSFSLFLSNCSIVLTAPLYLKDPVF